MVKEHQPEAIQAAEESPLSYVKRWGTSSLPPTLLATLITAVHAKPLQKFPLSFTPVLLFSTWLNLSSYVVDSAGLTAAWSGLYILLARRRKTPGFNMGQRLGNRFGVRGVTRGAAIGVAGMNVLGGGVAYLFGKRKDENEGEV